MVGLSMVAGIWPVAVACQVVTGFSAFPAGLHAEWAQTDHFALWPATWMLGAGVILSIATAGVALITTRIGRRGRVWAWIVVMALPVAFGSLMAGQWLGLWGLYALGIGLFVFSGGGMFTLRFIGVMPVTKSALTDTSYSVFKPSTYQAARVAGGPLSEALTDDTNGDKPTAGAPRVPVVANWPATLVGLLAVPGVLASWSLLVTGRVWGFVGGAVVCLTVPWWLSRQLMRRRLTGTRLEGQATALSTWETALVSIALLAVVAGAFVLSETLSGPAVGPLASSRGEIATALLGTLVGLMLVVFAAFCVPLFGRRRYAAATTRAWVSWGVYLFTVVATFVVGDGWPVAGTRWQGWGLFAALTLVVTVMVWHQRRVRPAQRRGRAE
jgi:hypothetical protein